MLRLSDFDYNLPKELVAQYPSETRGLDRLLVLDRGKGAFEEREFSHICGYLKKGDLLVLNNTKVIPARLFGKRKTGGRVEIFIVEGKKGPVEALVRPSARIKNGESIALESGDRVKILGRSGIGRFVEFERPIDSILAACGHVPLPPYIPRPDEPFDRERYQTVYAAHAGATASPTAGLHFTDKMIEKLKEGGVDIAYVTLHVSYGTFAPVKEDAVERHRMHSEYYRIPEEEALRIEEAANRRKGRIFACGTTSLRALETYAASKKLEGRTDLFIYPGYDFKIVDALITNFHLPKSTLFLLACAFAGRDLLFRAYRYAIDKRFKFFSYGDAMLII